MIRDSDDSNSHDNKKKQNSNSSSKSCKVISKLLLPQDLIIAILTLVPLNCLLNSARYVCKSWATTIRTSYFVEACLHHARSKPGLYVENCTNESSSYFLDIKDYVNGYFVFERTDLGTPPRMGRIIGNCDGILLLYQSPILKWWLRVPPLPISKVRFDLEKRFTIVRVPHTAEFKLFFIDILEVSGDFWYVFYVLRVGIDNSWKEIARKKTPRERYDYCQPLYNGGNYLYWIVTIQGVTMVDIDKEIIVRELPFPPVLKDLHPRVMFLWMGNCLSCILYKDLYYRTFQIYILDFSSEIWSFYHEMTPFDYLIACGHELKSIVHVVFCFWINDQIIFRVITWEGNIFTGNYKTTHFSYNVKTRQSTKIEDIDVGDIEVWLHTNSLFLLPT
ncbi:F-box/kelch-repeat protein [Trifolium repens]|nr:F-box/kelch-repeat protein [Trifolium repens]